MLEQEKIGTQTLDPEWIELMQAAKDLGLSIEEIREYLLAFKVSKPV
ncbi:anti-repressor SinI family protein [Domibacillus sp.]|nr:anti-repressor SinI family protein [Domibacillus sp.]